MIKFTLKELLNIFIKNEIHIFKKCLTEMYKNYKN